MGSSLGREGRVSLALLLDLLEFVLKGVRIWGWPTMRLQAGASSVHWEVWKKERRERNLVSSLL